MLFASLLSIGEIRKGIELLPPSHSGDEAGTGAALALNESARARPARARAAAIAALTLVTLRVRLRTATARNSFAVLLNFLSRTMALSLSQALHILSVN